MVNPLALIGTFVTSGAFLFGVPPVSRAMNYWTNKQWSNAEFSPYEGLQLWYFGVIDDSRLTEILKKNGYSEDKIDEFKLLAKKWLTAEQVANAVNRGFISEEEYYEYMHKLGYTKEEANKLKELEERRLGAGDLVELLYRGKITEEQYYQMMKEIGFDKEKADYVKELYKYIPSPADFVRFAVREVFNPQVVEKYGYDEEFPKDIVPYARMRGMDEETLKWYWRAHWELPSPTMAFEMLHRLNPEVLNTPTTLGGTMRDKYAKMGLDVSNLEVTVEDVRTLLKVADYPKYWRDRITAISFTPLTRVDLRRIYTLGLINEQELKARLMELGYSSEDADLMIEFYKAYKNQQEKDFSKSEVLKLYRLRAIKREEAIEMLKNIGYDENEADYLLDLEDYKYYSEWLEERVRTLEIMYIKGAISQQEFYEELASLGLPSEQMGVYVERAERRKLQAIKMPSKKDLMNMLKSGVLTPEEFKQYMKRLGYDDFWIEKYLQLLGVGA